MLTLQSRDCSAHSIAQNAAEWGLGIPAGVHGQVNAALSN